MSNLPPEPNTPQRDDIAELASQIKALLDKPRRKDAWDVLTVVTSFLSTVVLAGISLFVTLSYQQLERDQSRADREAQASREAAQNKVQLEIQRAQIKIEEFKAITTIAPLMANKDPGVQAAVRALLKASKETGLNIGETNEPDKGPNTGSTSSGGSGRVASSINVSLIDSWLAVALSDQPLTTRLAAVNKIGNVSMQKSLSAKTRDAAADAALQIYKSPKASPEVKTAAKNILEQIKKVTIADIGKLIAESRVTRKVTEVIIHHTFTLAQRYKGAESVFAFAKYLLEERKFKRLAWHFAIAHNGDIWLGAPLNEKATHTRGHDPQSISIELIMNGMVEEPTELQRKALATVLRSLFARLKLNPESGTALRFHSELSQTRCPGPKVTREMILGDLALVSQ